VNSPSNASVDFSTTFAPELAVFAPPRLQKDAGPSVSSTWPRSSPITTDGGQLRGNIRTSLTNGTAVLEEASAVRPISLRQRGTRLSFRGGRRKGSQQSNGDVPSPVQSNGENSESNSQHSKSIENMNRMLRTQPSNISSSPSYPLRNDSLDVTGSSSIPSRSRKSKEIVDVVESDFGRLGEGGVLRIRSVRKRLSVLKLGKRPSKSNGFVGGLSEES